MTASSRIHTPIHMFQTFCFVKNMMSDITILENNKNDEEKMEGNFIHLNSNIQQEIDEVLKASHFHVTHNEVVHN
jgi:hypothetical protein